MLIAQFTDILLNRGSGSDTLRRLDKAQKGFLTKDEFIEGISMSESSDDSDTLNIYYPKAHAEILADKFFENHKELDFADFMQIAANLNVAAGMSHAALHAEGLGWQQGD